MPIALIAAALNALAAGVVLATETAANPIESVANIERAAKTFLTRTAGASATPLVEVRVDPVDPRLRLHRCDQDLDASLAPGARATGNTSVNIRCRSPVPWSLFVSARVERYGDVVVVKSPIHRGTLIQAAHVTLERRTTSDLLRGYFVDASQVIGMQSRRSLRPGQVVSESHIDLPLWVERGQRIRLVSQAGAIQVSVSGEALEDGNAGDRIRVRNASSERELEGQVESPGVVRIPM
jgi:flagella basal body P-ring formation protein FlgA